MCGFDGKTAFAGKKQYKKFVRFTGKYFTCNKPGHRAKDYRQKKAQCINANNEVSKMHVS